MGRTDVCTRYSWGDLLELRLQGGEAGVCIYSTGWLGSSESLWSTVAGAGIGRSPAYTGPTPEDLRLPGLGKAKAHVRRLGEPRGY